VTEQLIRRDLPLQPGRKLRFTFTIAYEVPLDEDLWADCPVTLDELERYYGPSAESIWRVMHENYDRDVIEHTAALADVDDSYDSPLRAHRFELEWERDQRLQGNAEAVWFRTRRWLDEIPAASKAGASA
jgi:hypothetical protein